MEDKVQSRSVQQKVAVATMKRKKRSSGKLLILLSTFSEWMQLEPDHLITSSTNQG